MCLAVPGKIVEWIDRNPTFARASVEFDGVRRVCHMACVTDAELGDYVIVHAGVAISKVDAADVQSLLDEFARLQELEDAGQEDGWREAGAP
jgi:hydrogenase expression/formation protein HypC